MVKDSHYGKTTGVAGARYAERQRSRSTLPQPEIAAQAQSDRTERP